METSQLQVYYVYILPTIQYIQGRLYFSLYWPVTIEYIETNRMIHITANNRGTKTKINARSRPRSRNETL